MLREQYTNGLATTLNGAINNSVTSVVVTDASSWPSEKFRVKIESEIMYVTSRSTNTLTVIRGYEGTTAVSHADTLPINHVITAGALDGFKADLYAAMGFGRVPTSGNTYGDEFDDDNFSGWTSVTNATPVVTVTEQDKILSLSHPGSDAAAQFHAWMKDTGGTLSVGNAIEMCVRPLGISSNYHIPGLFMSDGVTYNAGNQVGWHWSPMEDSVILRSMTGFNAQVAFNNSGCGMRSSMMGNYFHMKMEYRGSNTWSTYLSPNGFDWFKIHNAVSLGATTPRYIGFGISSWGSSTTCIHCIKSFRTNF